MSSNGEGGFTLWTVVKVALITAGLLYIVSLFTWFAQWATILVAIGGVGYLGYKIASVPTSRPAKPKMLASEAPFDARLRQLEAEERVLDRKIGI